MIVTLYTNFSKRKNSTKQPQGGTQITCYMKHECSIENPVFLIDGIDLAVNYIGFNGAYYFVDDIVLNKNDIYEVSCSIDVLATFKTQIGASTQFVERSASTYDDMIPDNLLSTTNEIVSVSSSTTALAFYDTTGIYLIQTFSASGVNVYAYGNLQDISGILNNNAYNSDAGWLDALVQTVGLNIFDVSAYVSNPVWLPVKLSALGGDTTTPVCVGFWNLDINTYPADKHIHTFTIQDSGTIAVPAGIYTDYRRYDSTYSRYNLYLPAVGCIPLPSIYAGNTINFTVTVDIFSGNCSYKLYSVDGAGSALIGKYSGQMGTQIPYSTTRMDTLGLLQTILAPDVNLGSGSGASMYAGIAQSAVNFAFDVTRATIEPAVSINSTAGNMTELSNYPNILCTVTNFGCKEFPLAEGGRPLYEHKQINTLSGYIKCGNPSLDIAGHGTEKDQVNSYLANGFYYE